MVNYKCSICNRKFNHKGDHKRHINRKNKCKEKSSQNIQKLNNKKEGRKKNCMKKMKGTTGGNVLP